ncbi:MAG: hypothetical protein AAF735_05255 [Myxococcota bacterium]
MNRFILGIAFAASLAIAAATAQATSLVKIDFKTLVQGASACVVAETTRVSYAMVDGSPVTRTVFSVSKTAFGKTPKTLTVVTPGGQMKGRKVVMGEVNAGAPRFLNGTESVLLLQEIAGGDYAIAGYSQGVFDVVREDSEVSVRLPESQGGATSIDNALSIINRARRSTNESVRD